MNEPAKAVKPPANYVWRPGYQGVYRDPGSDLHGLKMTVEYRDPCGSPGLAVTFAALPSGADGAAIDEDKLWFEDKS
jgi:hypothetical protein